MEAKLQGLIIYKNNLFQSLEFGIRNSDRGMVDLCERELKRVMKEIEQLREELEEEGNNEETSNNV